MALRDIRKKKREKMIELEKIKNKFDLNSKFPGYFNKTIFRILITFLLFVLIFGVLIEGIDTKVKVSCNSDGIKCINQIYKCKHEISKNSVDYFLNDCEQYEDIKCSDNICSKKYLNPGESIGKDSFIIENYNIIALISILLSFGINHLIYVRRKRR